jgi:DTW domain-containing protein
MRHEICLCQEIAAFRQQHRAQTRVVVLMHHREEHLTTNTAHLATLLLPHCELYIRGEENQPLDPEQILDSSKTPLFLYPSEDARHLTPELLLELKKPPYLIVPDGSWRQASKVARRESFLKDVARVTLVADAPSRYRLRREPKTEGLATFEAIARALGVLEDPALRAEMERIFELMVERTLKSREGILSGS